MDACQIKPPSSQIRYSSNWRNGQSMSSSPNFPSPILREADKAVAAGRDYWLLVPPHIPIHPTIIIIMLSATNNHHDGYSYVYDDDHNG